MARKHKEPAAEKADGSGLMMKPSVILTENTPTYYVNNADIACSPYEFALAFSRLPAKPTIEQINEVRATGGLGVEAEVQLLLPPSVIPGLIRALSLQMGVYEKQFAPIYDPGATE